MSVTTRILGAAAIAGLLAASAAIAEDPPADSAGGQGPEIATIARNCLGCHGPEAVSPGAMPTLAGKTETYLAARLTEFRDGMRPSTIMGRIMKPFADEDIQHLAAYFAGEKVEVTQ